MNISRVLKERNISLKDLAEKLGVSYSTISKTVTGNPTAETLEKIASIVNCEVGDFFREKSNRGSITCPKCGAPLNIEIKEQE